MKDHEIQELLNSDKSIPQKPGNEWSSILTKIDSPKKEKFHWGLSLTSFALFIAVLVSSYQGYNYYKKQQDKALVEFLIESGDYFQEDEQLYNWIAEI